MSNDIFASDGVSLSEVDRDIVILAEALARKHGRVTIRKENQGVHLYMPSPKCLEEDGKREIQACHLTVNADRYLGLGKFINKKGTYNADASALCHKTDTRYLVSELLAMPPLEERGIPNAPRGELIKASHDRYLVDDGNGNMIPAHPGKVIPIIDLPEDHPAVIYLRDRGYNLSLLHLQFRCGYCFEETPESKEHSLFYKRMPQGFKDTPQGRIIFYVDMEGVQNGWQARVIDKCEGNTKYYLHPYSQAMTPVYTRESEESEWTLMDSYADDRYNWKPSKYKTGQGALRNQLLMGYDAAVRWNAILKHEVPFCVLVEGPLDAGRIGPPGVAMLGKYLSRNQALALRSRFRRVIFIPDTDKAGKASKDRFLDVMSEFTDMQYDILELPDSFKDVGEMTYEQVWKLIKQIL